MTKDNKKSQCTYYPYGYPVDFEYRLRKYLFAGKSELIDVAVSDTFNELVILSNSNMPLLRSWLINAIAVIYHKSWQLGTPLRTVLPGINSLLEIIDLAEKEDRPFEIDRLRELFKEHISIVWRLVNHKSEIDTSTLSIKAKRYIQANFHRNLIIKDVAEAVHVDEALLRVILSKEFGLSFHEYLIKIKINEAKKMLVGTKFSIAAIALQIGFRDSSYFIRVFKCLEGITPGQYAKRRNIDFVKVKGLEKISSEGIEAEKVPKGKLWIQKERNALVSFLGGDFQTTVSLLNKLLAEINEEVEDLDYIKAYALKMIIVFTRKSMQIGIPSEDILNNLTILSREVRVLESSELVRAFVHRIIKELLDRVTLHYNESAVRAVEAVKMHIHRNYSQPIQLNDLARLVNFSPFYICRLFTKLTDLTIYNYITLTRIEEAKRLICTTDYTIGEIAERVGYQDSSNFMTLFKKKVGHTPREYAELSRIQFRLLNERA
ncbi:hypothetical protein JCM17380_25750 [Desulfosporosinus burensis]